MSVAVSSALSPSAAAATVTGCGRRQLEGVKVRLVGVVVTSALSEATLTVTSVFGSLARCTV